MSRILVVDDHEQLRQSLVRAIEAAGHEVMTAPDGRAALDLLENWPADLVITDLNMPEMDGIELVTTLVESGSNLKIIAMSGGGRIAKEELLLDARFLGAMEVIAKPFTLEALVACIDAVLQHDGS